MHTSKRPRGQGREREGQFSTAEKVQEPCLEIAAKSAVEEWTEYRGGDWETSVQHHGQKDLWSMTTTRLQSAHGNGQRGSLSCSPMTVLCRPWMSRARRKRPQAKSTTPHLTREVHRRSWHVDKFWNKGGCRGPHLETKIGPACPVGILSALSSLHGILHVYPQMILLLQRS